MSDLVKRLLAIVEAGENDERADAFDAMTTGERVDLEPTYVEMSLVDARALAARIEELEAANRGLVRLNEATEARADRLAGLLRRWESYGCPDCHGDCASANPPIAACIMRETYEALK